MADGGLKINESVIKQLLNEIYSSKKPNKRKLFRETFKHLSAGVIKGYGKNLPKVNYNSPDFKMLNELSYNVGVFSIFKNHDYIRETVKLLKDNDGKLRSKKDFIKEARKLDNTYNKRYLATEYDQAVSAARMAKKWQDIERTKHLYPNLMYVAVNDDRTRQLHRNWHGIVLPIDHVFWDTRYPPNDWGCRCSVRRTDKPIDDRGVDVENLPKLPKQFNTNVGKTGKVFNTNHPYFKIPEFKKVALFARMELISFQRKELKSFAKLSGLTKKQFTSQIGEVRITTNSFKELLGKYSKYEYFRNNMLYDLKNILKDAIYIKSAASNKLNPMVKQYHYLLIEVDEKRYYLNIRELVNGEHILYAITDKIK